MKFEISLYEHVEYDYHSYYPCQHGSDCCDNDMCRCETIENAHVKKVHIKQLVRDFKLSIDRRKLWSPIEEYCFERLIIFHELHIPGRYEIQVCGGYYGDEIRGIECDPLAAFETNVEILLNLSDDDKVRFVLEKEYDHVLPELINATFEVVDVNYEDIVPGRNVSGPVLESDLPIGIYRSVGSKYQIIDGHHRWNNWKKRITPIILAKF